jgi:hypothetical protein
MQLIKPFGPTVAKVIMPKNIIDSLNKYVDEIINNESKSKELDYGKMLAGNVKQEFLLEREFSVFSGWEGFLKENVEEWIFKSLNKKITQFDIIDSWIVRQFENDYNPLHAHGGHVSGVGYLKLPDDFGKPIQNTKTSNINGNLQLVHGSNMFLSPVTLDIKPKVGEFIFFPNYLMHTVYPFKNKNSERRSISFNASIDDDIYNIYGKS